VLRHLRHTIIEQDTQTCFFYPVTLTLPNDLDRRSSPDILKMLLYTTKYYHVAFTDENKVSSRGYLDL